MPLYCATITFTGNKEGLPDRPNPKRVAVKASNLDKAAVTVSKYARKYWPYWRFEITQLHSSKVLE